MDTVAEALRWLNDPLNWTGRNGVLELTATHLTVTALAVLLGTAVALPLGLWLGHLRAGATVGVVVSNTTRALPTLALLTLLAASGLFGSTATVLACAVFAAPPVLANTVTGIAGVDPAVRDAARGTGLSRWQVLRQVELPLAVPLVAAGLRTAVVQVIATVPLAALVGGRSLGTVVVTGFGLQRYGQVVAGGLLVAGLCLLAELVLALLQRVASPRGLRLRDAARRTTAGRPSRRRRSRSGDGPAVAGVQRLP
ncbi:ABC transporter permease [Cellulomonas marina]|uniref:Osmoprotectant transport system permease protein n=1 Tax=Cellulomonas marina TaxID=988821 RepID=A0A1I0V743_9CELL|nr:ABC transporter permease [Cellulomonas marina]GIG28381.1 glycine/betaine ABC transporter permease [Cellulomonas marina]SFA72194.1 osmoprotectant transport system permease protein [Cellulomonas marina]